jgi:hypothetical protein
LQGGAFTAERYSPYQIKRYDFKVQAPASMCCLCALLSATHGVCSLLVGNASEIVAHIFTCPLHPPPSESGTVRQACVVVASLARKQTLGPNLALASLASG